MLLTLTLTLGAALAGPLACNADQPSGCVARGLDALRADRTRTAQGLFWRACHWGGPVDCEPLLIHFDQGWDVLEAWDERCTEGSGRACNELGRLLFVGPDLLADSARAFKLYAKGCELGSAAACGNAASLALNGTGTARDATSAYALHQRGCALGWGASCEEAAAALMDGRGILRDTYGAVALLQRACDEGAASACARLADWLDVGRGVPADRPRAVELRATACEGGEGLACHRMGHAVREGVTDPMRAAVSLSLACRRDVPWACPTLAELREEGRVPWSAATHPREDWAMYACRNGSASGCREAADAETDPALRRQYQLEARRLSPGPTAPAPDSVAIALAFLPDEATTRACFERHVQVLASDLMEGRGPGTAGLERAARYLDEAMASLGLAVQTQTVVLDADASTVGRNVIGVARGRGALAAEAVVLGAHYDSFGMDAHGVIWPGADDNASGVAGMLCAAEALVGQLPGEADHRALVVVAFDGEEIGLRGSKRYVEEPTVPLDLTAAMVNVDMIGRLAKGPLRATTAYAPEWPALVDAAAAGLGLPTHATRTESGGSDHLSFLGAGVPALHLGSTTSHGDYHQPTDTASRLDPRGAAAITRAIAAITHALLTGEAPTRPTADPCLEWTLPFGAGMAVGQDFSADSSCVASPPDRQPKRQTCAPETGSWA